jgi:protein TonB
VRVATADFGPDVRFPVVGELHPIRKRAQRILINAAITAGAFHVIGFGGWLIYRNYKPEHIVEGGPTVVHIIDMGVPPSLSQEESAPAVNVAAQVAPPSIGIPEPVPDFKAEAATIATTEEMSAALVPTDMSMLGGEGDSLVVDLGGSGDPNPGDFVQYEDPPVPISVPPPDYPEMARMADVEGTVMVRALVGKDGNVKEAIVANGIPMLNDAAIEAVKKAKFKPALQQHRPVAVWVVIPMKFKLN